MNCISNKAKLNNTDISYSRDYEFWETHDLLFDFRHTIVDLSTGGVDGQVNQAVGVSPLVIIPRNDLVEVVVEEDAGTGINSGGGAVVNKITRNNFILSVCKDTLHIALSGFLESTKDFVLSGSLFGAEGQIDERNIGGRDLWV